MSRIYKTSPTNFLAAIAEATGFFKWPPEGTESWRQKQIQNDRPTRNILYRFKRRGLVQEISKEGKRFIRLTSKGEMELLFKNIGPKQPKRWKGGWWLIFFDIPEDCRSDRDKLRLLLKKSGFVKLQASVFISPYPLNDDSVTFLRRSELINYIRIMEVKVIDDDRDLKKKFHLA